MDTQNPVIQLCVAGTKAEFDGRMAGARESYQQAWEIAQTDYEACIAAHYLARFQETLEDKLRWNQEALERARRVNDQSVKEFYPSLYLNLGYSHELLGNQAEAQQNYSLAAQLGAVRQLEE
jgi:hypothetical protein